MRKDYYEILNAIIKTAPPHQQIVNVRGNGSIVEATDSKRLVKITLEQPLVADGIYQIAKLGKDFGLIGRGDQPLFPDSDRIIPKDVKRDFTVYTDNDVSVVTAKILRAWIVAQMQERQMADHNEPTILNPDFLAPIVKQLSKVAESVVIGYTQARYPVLITTECGYDKIEYVLMPMGW